MLIGGFYVPFVVDCVSKFKAFFFFFVKIALRSLLNSEWTKLFPLSQEWPQTHHASLSFLPPVPRPPDLPTEKPPRPNLMYRIYRRLQNYWFPPVEGKVVFAAGRKCQMSACVSMHLLCFYGGFRAPCEAGARALGGQATLHFRAHDKHTEQEPCEKSK